MLRTRYSSRRKPVIAAVTAALVLATMTVPAGAAIAAGTATLAITKANDLAGAPLQAGDDINYTLYLSCSSIEIDCANFTFEDTLPAELVVDVASLPTSTPSRLVTYDSASHKLTIVYQQRLDNPTGTGLLAGTNETLDIKMTLPADTPLLDGASISNSATVTADNATPQTATDVVQVTVPRVVTPVATKQWPGSAAVAGSAATSTVHLGVRNASSSSAKVTSLAVTDDGSEVFDRFNLREVALVSLPAGTDRAQVFFCTDPTLECADGAYTGGGTLTAAAAFAFPAGVDPATITGVRVVFSHSAGTPIPTSATAGFIDLTLALRSTIRSTGAEQKPTERTTVANCATPSATDSTGATTVGTAACASKDILPDTLVLTATKSFFADTNQNFSRDAGEHAVINKRSPVSAVVRATNESPFALAEVTIAEPAATAPAEFAKFDTEIVRLTLPEGAASALLLIGYSDGSSTTTTHTENTLISDAARPGVRITSVSVTYRGAAGAATIVPGASASLGLSGLLNALVTNDDLAGGSSAGVDNCARVSGIANTTNGTGASAANACDTVAVETAHLAGTGVKTVGRASIPFGEPIPFTLRFTNSGNLPLTTPVITDPPVDASDRPTVAGNPFAVLRIVDAAVTKSSGTGEATIEVFDPAADAWVAFDPANAALLDRATGIRASLAGELPTTQYFQLNLTAERRSGTPDGTALSNCFVLTATGYVGAEPACSPATSTGPTADGASVNKMITPSALPVRVAGLPEQYTSVNLTVRNTGNLSARELGIEDGDTKFFESVDFVDFTAMTPPAASASGSTVRIDAYVKGAWVRGVPAERAALPTGVAEGEVTGIRATFGSTSTANGGHVFTPCGDERCTGKVTFRVTPRATLRSDASTAVASPIHNTATGFYATWLQAPGVTEKTDPVTSTLELNGGTPRLDVDKTPNAVISPGERVPFTLKVTNTGTASIPNLRVVDSIPAGLSFDEEYAGDNGQPFSITAVDLPAGTPAVPAPTFSVVREGEHVAQATFDFGAWMLAPGATFSIVVQMKLEPGVLAGQLLTNTMAAGSPIAGLACEKGDGTSGDGSFGVGTFCTDTATARTRAGASFESRKWIAGNHDLGWYNGESARPVPIGDASCPSFTENGETYTATPCVALVNPGDPINFLIRVRNAGTEPGTQMTIIDRLPAAGDTGVLGADRGTQWDNRPTLAAAPVVTGGGSALALDYSSGKTLCTEDIDYGTPGTCAPDDWTPTFAADATAFQAAMDFSQKPLSPGAGVTIAFQMVTPLRVTQVSDPTIAWNSIAHSEVTQRGDGSARILAPIEPIKVGVATSYGSLVLEKTLGANPAKVQTGDLKYTFQYECTIAPGDGTTKTVVASGTERLSVGAKKVIDAIPAGAECLVWESDAKGAVSDHPSRATAHRVTIEPHFGTPAPAPIPVATAPITNSYPMGVLRVTKAVTGDAASYGVGPFSVRVSCEYNGAVVSGFPLTLTFRGAQTQEVAAPVGAACTITETNAGGATDTSITPSTPVVIPAVDTGGVYLAPVVVTNRFDAGSIVITKTLTGVGVAANPDRDYVFSVDCSFNGVDHVYTGDVTLRAVGDADTITSEPITGLPLGAECVVTETDAGGADTVPDPVTVVVVADPLTDNTVTVGL